MISKLSFKGEKPTKRKAKTENGSRKKKAVEESVAKPAVPVVNPKSWVFARDPADIAGPIVFASFLRKDVPLCLKVSEEGRVVLSHPLEHPDETNISPSAIEPESTRQVFVVQPVVFGEKGLADSEIMTKKSAIDNTSKKVAFKSVQGKFLATDNQGIVTAKATAIGAPQTFTVIRAGTLIGAPVWRLCNTWGKYIRVVPLKSKDGPGYGIDALAEEEEKEDDENENENENNDGASLFVLRVQAQYQSEYKQQFARGATTAVAGKSLDEDYISSKVLREKAGRELTREEIKMLKKAHTDGRLNEALLDLRQKSKTDTRCY
ncbi:uncharacterized protein SAPINGB_P005499 [Magnusiomyces paraingens]|uniref:Protein FRG1 n=1 Tax=Magnusiomyces paraingens TaxID=2606893 RepID=A0A5E8C228_9ASCO|nr:uncharacterized protein SAPINGB_P005499 [Saprochaete ingens]VVT57030.1 unnamed protein product [Saprochaete ingens]